MGSSGGGGPTTSHLDPLHRTIESLGEIRAALLPFLRLLREDSFSSSSVGRRPRDGHRKKKRSNTTRDESSSSSSPAAPPEKKKRGRPPLSDDREDDDCGGGDGVPPTPVRRRLDPHRRAEAEAAVALAVGTMRYMGARLRGSDSGRKRGDPLRAELDRMRAALVSLRQLEGGASSSRGGGGGDADDDDGACPGDEGGKTAGGPSTKKKQKGGRIHDETARGDDGGK